MAVLMAFLTLLSLGMGFAWPVVWLLVPVFYHCFQRVAAFENM
jgi:hypothetical protein